MRETSLRIFKSLGALGTILGTTLVTPTDAGRIKRATNDVITNTREILNTTTANEDDRMLLERMAFTANIGVNFVPIR